jgi:hypothetical protein
MFYSSKGNQAREDKTMTTYAIYVEDKNGTVRVGTFQGPKGSVRSVSAALRAKMPNLPSQGVWIARRVRLMGNLVDGERLPADFS